MTRESRELIALSSSALDVSFGITTVIPCCRLGVTSMKIIRSTNMMSTIGVTLISELRPPPPPDAIPIIKTPSKHVTQAKEARPLALSDDGKRTALSPDADLNLRVQLPRAILQE